MSFYSGSIYVKAFRGLRGVTLATKRFRTVRPERRRCRSRRVNAASTKRLSAASNDRIHGLLELPRSRGEPLVDVAHDLFVGTECLFEYARLSQRLVFRRAATQRARRDESLRIERFVDALLIEAGGLLVIEHRGFVEQRRGDVLRP